MTVRSAVQELRLDSPPRSDFGWTIGVFRETRRDSSISSTIQADPATGEPEAPLSYVFTRTSGVEFTQRAIFGEASWSPLDRLTVRLGARRYDYEKTSRAQVLLTSYINASVAGPETTHDNDASGWVRRATASYRFNDRATGYAQYSEGFRPGGVNNTPGLDAALVTYAADRSSNLEIGLKTIAADGRLLMDFAAYQVRWSDMQVAARVPNFNFIANAGEATIRGFEVEGQLSLTDALVARWSLNLIDGRLTSRPDDAGFALAGDVGDTIPYEPDLRASMAFEHRRSVGRGLTLKSGMEMVRIGEAGSTFDRSDPYYETMGNYWLVHLGARLEAATWSASLRVENALNARGVVWAGSREEYERNQIVTTPRTLRVSLEKRW